MIEFYPLPLDKITDEDLKWLIKSLKDDKPDAVRQGLLDGSAVLWRYVDSDRSGRGVVVLQEFVDEMYIWHLGGINIRPGMFHVIETVAAFAKLKGKTSVRCLAPKALLKTYARLGLEIENYMLRKEI